MSTYPRAALLVSAAHERQFPRGPWGRGGLRRPLERGKSSAINALTARHGLARTTKTPGRTRLLNFFELAPLRRIVDLPGYGYASAGRGRARELGADDLGAGRALLAPGSVPDRGRRRGLMRGDWELLDWAEAAQRPVHVLLTKADKLKRAESRQALARRDGDAVRPGNDPAFFGRRRHGPRGRPAAARTLASRQRSSRRRLKTWANKKAPVAADWGGLATGAQRPA